MMLQRYNITTLLQMLLIVCTLVSCIDDSIIDGGECSSDKETHYLGIQLKFDTDASPTRAANEEFVGGTDDEHNMAITSKNFVIFFKDGVFIGIYDLTDKEEDKDRDDNDYEYTEAKYTYVTRFPARATDLPNSCLVVLNGKAKIYDQLKKYEGEKDVRVSKIVKEAWEETDDPRNIGYADLNHKYFTMTNSVYYKDDADGNTIKRDTVGFDAEKHIKKTYAEAKREPITVYVERMVAKFSFDLLNDKRIFQPSEKADMIVFDGFSNGSPKYKMKKWQIEVTGWNVNALETKSYVFKNLQNPEYFTKWESGFKWNDDSNFRSYWCEDPHYDYQYEDESENKKNRNTPWKYSWQYRRSVDFGLQYYDEEEENPEELPLRNYSFEELNLGKPNKKPDGSEFENAQELKEYIDNDIKTKIVYTPENTYDPEVVAGDNGKLHDSRDELLAGTHLLVGAEFQIEQGNDDDSYFIETEYPQEHNGYRMPKHLFRDRNGFCFLSERECVASLVHDFNQLLESQSTMVFTHYDWNVNGSSSETLIADTKGKYKLYYKDNTGVWKELKETDILDEEIFSNEELAMPIAATIRRGDGKRLPWIKKLVDGNRLAIGLEGQTIPTLTIYGTKPDDYETLVKDENAKKGNVTENNYIKSMLYEWLGAIDHFNQGKMYYSIPVKQANYINKEDKNAEIYGVVRNNWYKFTLQDVKALGTSIDNADQPIVPERVGLNDEINFTIRILGWHDVETDIPLTDLNGNVYSNN